MRKLLTWLSVIIQNSGWYGEAMSDETGFAYRNSNCRQAGNLIVADHAEQRYKVKVRQYPHPLLFYYKRNGHYRLTMDDSIKNMKWGDIEAHVRKETGIAWMAKGFKQADSVDRLIMLRTYEEEGLYRKGNRVLPLSKWTQKHVLAHMQLRRIPSPSVLSGSSTGVALVPWVLYEIYEKFPDDYERIRREFPLIENAIARVIMSGR